MEIMYIANEGFLIKVSNQKILIDAIFGKFESDWCDVPSADMNERMEKGVAPFDRIDVILISHAHIDHFNAAMVANHLESNEAAILICPKQVAQELHKEGRYEKISPRIQEITPEYEMSMQQLFVKGMGIEVWRLPHSPFYVENEETHVKQNKHEHVQNLGFTIDVDQKKIFHGGDWAYEVIRGTSNPLDENLDIAFLGVESCLRLYDPKRIRQHKLPENIILMHLYPIGNLDELTEEERSTISGVTIFKSPMESKLFGN